VCVYECLGGDYDYKCMRVQAILLSISRNNEILPYVYASCVLIEEYINGIRIKALLWKIFF